MQDDGTTFCAALAASTSLTALTIDRAGLNLAPRAASGILRAATRHPSLRVLVLSVKKEQNDPPPAERPECPEFADSAAALVAAVSEGGVPLHTISLFMVNDAECGPLIRELGKAGAAGAPTLKRLSLDADAVSESFARSTLLPAVKACTSLTDVNITVRKHDYKVYDVLRQVTQVASRCERQRAQKQETTSTVGAE